MKVFDEKEIEREIALAKANFAMEGLEIPVESQELAAKVLRGELAHKDAMKMLIENYEEE